MNSRVLVRVQKLNRIFNGDNVVVLRLVNEIDDGRQGRAFSAAGRTRNQHNPFLISTISRS
jgi:hypothetical protein